MKKMSKFYRLKIFFFLINGEIPSLWIERLNIVKDIQFMFLLGMVPVFHHYDVGYCFLTFMMFRKYSIPQFLKI